MPSDTPLPQCWLDDETGSLDFRADVWEHALLRQSPAGVLTQYVWRIIDFDPSAADEQSLKFGHFYERHPMHVILDTEDPLRRAPTGEEKMLNPAFSLHGPNLDEPVHLKLATRAAFVDDLERLTRGAVVWACNPVFDVPKLQQVMAHPDLLPFQRRSWSAHYRPMCATTHAGAVGRALGLDVGPFPYSNAEVGAAFGVSRDGFGTAHSALADAHYAHALVRAADALIAERT